MSEEQTGFNQDQPDALKDAGDGSRPNESGGRPSSGSPTVGRSRWIAGATAAVGVALFAVPLLRGPEGPALAGDIADATCPAKGGRANLDFTMKDANGASVRLSDYKGQVILLNFWATWCGPCKVEIPEFIEAYDRYRDRGFVILGVLSQDDPSADELKTFAEGYGMSYPIFRENADLDEAFGGLWAIPTSFIIDRQGSICSKHMGPVSKETLERIIERLL